MEKNLSDTQSTESREWSAAATSIGSVKSGLADLHRSLNENGRTAAERTLNLIVATATDRSTAEVEHSLSLLGPRSPARTIVLSEHPEPRLDAHVEVRTVDPPDETASFHERITLIADRPRLEAADSLVVSLLVRGLPVTVWLPGGQPGLSDAALAGIADQLVFDSSYYQPAAAIARALTHLGQASLHDLAWIRLEYWRARVAAAFDAGRCSIGQVEGLEIACLPNSPVSGLLLVGWVAARAQWEIDSLVQEGSSWLGKARRSDGQDVTIKVRSQGDAVGCGGVEVICLDLGDRRVDLAREGAAHRSGRALIAALDPVSRSGYEAALEALSDRLEEP